MKRSKEINKSRLGRGSYVCQSLAFLFSIMACMFCFLCCGSSGKERKAQSAGVQNGNAEGVRQSAEAVNLRDDFEELQVFAPDGIWEEGISSRNRENYIVYADGYYYYRSQLDNYYLYRAREDGTEQIRLAKVQPGSIHVDGETVYFINLSDQGRLYQIHLDGSGLGQVSKISFSYLAAWKDFFYFLSEDDSGRGLWRIRKDGSGRELVVKGDIFDFAADGETLVYVIRDEGADGYQLCFSDMNGEGKAEMLHTLSECPRNIQIYRQHVYYNLGYDNNQLYIMSLSETDKRFAITLPGREWKIENGALYCLSEDVQDGFRSVALYGMELSWLPERLAGGEGQDLGEKQEESVWKLLYESKVPCSSDEQWDLMAYFNIMKEKLFLCQFQSAEQGLLWVSVDKGLQSCMWEDSSNIPVVLPAVNLEYGEKISAISALGASGEDPDLKQSVKAELTYEESRKIAFELQDETEAFGECRISICLPQFNGEVKGYQKINSCFRERYDQVIRKKEDFFAYAEEASDGYNYYINVGYRYIELTESYLMISVETSGYLGGIRNYFDFEPALFERDSGKQLALKDLFTVSEEEALQRLLASVYKYMECTENARLTLRERNILLEAYDPARFCLLKEGIGIYYPRYAIDAGAAGDFLFIIPYETVADIYVPNPA